MKHFLRIIPILTVLVLCSCSPKVFMNKSVLDYSQYDDQYDFRIVPKDFGYVLDPQKVVPVGEIAISFNEIFTYNKKTIASLKEEFGQDILIDKYGRVSINLDMAMKYFIEEAKKLGATGVVNFEIIIPSYETKEAYTKSTKKFLNDLTLIGTAVKFEK